MMVCAATRSPASNIAGLIDAERGDRSPARCAGVGYTDHTIASCAIRALASLIAQPRPWFLTVGFIRPHLPFNAPEAFYAKFDERPVQPPIFSAAPRLPRCKLPVSTRANSPLSPKTLASS